MSSRFGTSPLLQPELRRNLCFPSGGGLAVHLSRQWKPMLAGLRRLGPLLLASRNRAAILGHYGCYPEIPALAEDGADRFTTPDGNHFFELLRWCHARVWEQPQPDGVGYSVEFRNFEGNLFHKICLTPESDFAGFLDWVEEHQAIGIEGFSMLAPAPSEAALTAARPGGGEGKPVEMTELFLAFRHLMHAGLPVSVTLGDGETGMSHSHAFPFMRVGLADGWSYCTDGYESAEGGAVFHLRLDAVDALAVEPRWWEPGAPLQVRGLGAAGEPLFRLTPGKRKETGQWNRLVRASFGLAD